MNIQQAIKSVTENRDLTADEMNDVMKSIMTGEATPAQVGGFLIGLRMKGETVDEIAAAASVMRELSSKVTLPASKSINPEHIIDTCGTGGDSSGSFNISTASAFVVAAAGGVVAKHGNRSISSNSGSADVLEKLGVKIDLTPEQVSNCIEKVGVGFMFAPLHHSAMKHAIGPRKEMAVRTVFNLLGPLTNPAGAKNQVIGVFANQWLEPVAEVLNQLGSNHVLVVRAEDGLDEISINSATKVAELKDGKVTTYSITPEQFSMDTASLEQIKASDSEESSKIINDLLDNTAGPALDIVTLNAGASIYAAGLADSLQAGVGRAKQVIADGSAKEKLKQLVSTSNSF